MNEYHTIQIDSRLVKPGDLFVAIEGQTWDGHQFINQAILNGASQVMVHKDVDISVPIIRVQNTTLGLGALAKKHRANFSIPIIAITGSCGKTTVRNMTVAILSEFKHVLSSIKNYNNEIGLPLTLLQLNSTHDIAVLEMGARKLGDIEYLMKIAQPNLSLVTNTLGVHLEIFKSMDNLVHEKGQVYQLLSLDGTAILNQDLEVFENFSNRLTPSHKKITFSLSKTSDLSVEKIVLSDLYSTFDLIVKNEKVNIHLPVPGMHNISNALAAAALSCAAGASLAHIQTGLSKFKSTKQRLEIKSGLMGSKIIDDTYNAAPSSMRAAIEVLTQFKGNTILVMGDMGELGPKALALHEQIGRFAKEKNIQHLYGVGELTQHAIKSYGQGALWFKDKPSLISALKNHLSDNTTVLIKASRFMKLEEIVEAIAIC